MNKRTRITTMQKTAMKTAILKTATNPRKTAKTIRTIKTAKTIRTVKTIKTVRTIRAKTKNNP